jgi:hypothetical protein
MTRQSVKNLQPGALHTALQALLWFALLAVSLGLASGLALSAAHC